VLKTMSVLVLDPFSRGISAQASRKRCRMLFGCMIDNCACFLTASYILMFGMHSTKKRKKKKIFFYTMRCLRKEIVFLGTANVIGITVMNIVLADESEAFRKSSGCHRSTDLMPTAVAVSLWVIL
jgi:hypothetical protein